jgi:hypothetical protein
MACERILSRLACKPEVRAMTPMVATSSVPVGRLACAYFHSSAHRSNNLGGKSIDRFAMSPILILSLCVEIPIDTRCFVYFPWTRVGKNRNASHTAVQCRVHGQAIARSQTIVSWAILTRGRSDSHIFLQLRQNGKTSQTRKSPLKLRITNAAAHFICARPRSAIPLTL